MMSGGDIVMVTPALRQRLLRHCAEHQHLRISLVCRGRLSLVLTEDLVDSKLEFLPRKRLPHLAATPPSCCRMNGRNDHRMPGCAVSKTAVGRTWTSKSIRSESAVVSSRCTAWMSLLRRSSSAKASLSPWNLSTVRSQDRGLARPPS